jgi:hypothetical protein
MAEQATSTEQASKRVGNQGGSELREELARSQEEVLRLRDLLIGKDAEIGTLRGRLAELEEGSMRLVSAATRLRARLPGSARAVAARLQKLRRPRD